MTSLIWDWSIIVSDITLILNAVQQGDPKVAEELLPLIYDELRKLAARKMAHEAPGHTLQPTALVHEAWLKISRTDQQVWNGRQHFFAAAAKAMRRILVDRARRRHTAKRGADGFCLDADELDIPAPAPDDQLAGR